MVCSLQTTTSGFVSKAGGILTLLFTFSDDGLKYRPFSNNIILKMFCCGQQHLLADQSLSLVLVCPCVQNYLLKGLYINLKVSSFLQALIATRYTIENVHNCNFRRKNKFHMCYCYLLNIFS